MAMTMQNNSSTLLRLLHLVSPTLPTGAFAYSQGLEWAVESGWIQGGDDLSAWISDVMAQSLAFVDVPLLARLYDTYASRDVRMFQYWRDILHACRETRELRDEEENRGRALASLLDTFCIPLEGAWKEAVSSCQLAGFAVAASAWKIDKQEAACGYVWSWLENQILAGVKIIPLGQTEGQGILYGFTDKISRAVERGLSCTEAEIGAGLPALAIGSSCHETQYTRLYRS